MLRVHNMYIYSERWKQPGACLSTLRKKWLPDHSRYLQMHFLEWKLLNFKWYFIELCSLGSNWQYVIIGSYNGLALDWWQAIIWTNDGLVYSHIYASLGLNELISNKAWDFHKILRNLEVFRSDLWIILIVVRQIFLEVELRKFTSLSMSKTVFKANACLHFLEVRGKHHWFIIFLQACVTTTIRNPTPLTNRLW